MSKKTSEVDGLFVILFGPLILKIVSPLDPHSLIARRNPANYINQFILKQFSHLYPQVWFMELKLQICYLYFSLQCAL